MKDKINETKSKIEVDKKSICVADAGYHSEVEIVEAIKDAEIYSEIMNMIATEGKGLVFSSTGQIGEMEYDLNEDDLIETNISGTSSGAYSLTFLKAILKIASITEKLEISLKTDHPLKMIFNLLEGGELSYFLAPRVEEAEFEDDDDMDEF